MPLVSGAASVVPQATDALISMFTAVLGAENVFDGAQPISDLVTNYVVVGASDPFDVNFDEAATSDQGWQWLGLQHRQETFTVNCVAVSWNGDANPKTARDGAFTIMQALTNQMMTDPTLGLPELTYITKISGTKMRAGQDADGAFVSLQFGVEFWARLP